MKINIIIIIKVFFKEVNNTLFILMIKYYFIGNNLINFITFIFLSLKKVIYNIYASEVNKNIFFHF